MPAAQDVKPQCLFSINGSDITGIPKYDGSKRSKQDIDKKYII